MEVNLNPARGFFDALSRVVWAPALHEAHPEYAQAPEVVYTNASSSRQTDGRGYSTYGPRTRDVSCHSCRLGSSCGLRGGRLLLHLPVTLPQIKDLYIRTRVDLVDGVTRCSASFTVQVVTLHEDGVVTEAPDPHVPFTFTLQLHSFAYVQPCSLNSFCPVDIGELTQAKAISSRRIHVSIHSYNRTA